ncbi:MAG: hypothetical protein COV45_03970 [Deltaproteobacteria bacterium CG11_big_fil_rev_8_21_14_0_20_47_16]|nr:MAG: hypothetical protein COV45_03970 [Deltaproteobacteria bacterium CG11_big_fil_rev_8_21_14_0_20_47_16]
MLKRWGLILAVVVAVGLAFSVTSEAKSAGDVKWPLGSFINNQSVLARYYQDFAKRYPAESTTEQMRLFYSLLLDSDLLAERMSMLGGSPSDMRAVLAELSDVDISHPSRLSIEERQHLRSLLQTLDIQLENVDHSLSSGTRNEFRREVLADIPPLNRVG